MIYHVLPGDSLVEEFEQTGIEGQIIVCREALVDGPIDAKDLDEFWQQRAHFVLGEHGDDEIEYHEKVADQLNKLTELTDADEVNLWFEYELFCSVNLWFCLSLLAPTNAAVYRVEPIGLDEEQRWDGFGQFTADDLLASYELRSQLTKNDIDLGAALWRAYANKNHTKLKQLAASAQTDRFPYLNEVVAAAIEQEIRPLEIVREVTSNGEQDFAAIFAEFKKRAGVYGYGDTQVRKLIDQVTS